MRVSDPSVAEKLAIFAVLTALKSEDLRVITASEFAPPGSIMGFRIPFMEPPTFRIEVGRFRIHYGFDDEFIQVAYIGVY
jgi:hypothetical protein